MNFQFISRFGYFLAVVTLGLFSLGGSNTFAFEALPKKPPVPKNNPITPAKIEIGKQLYFDTRISKDGTVSCNSCHSVMGSGEDNRANSVGVHGNHGTRTAPTVWNSAFMSVLFWDGRAASLEEQAKGPMINPVEMGMDNHQEVEKRIRSIPGYVKEFDAAFKERPSVTIDTITKAIATYERTLLTPNSPFDKFIKGNHSAISAAAKRGMKLVEEKGCLACHNGPNFAGSDAVGEGRYLKFPMVPDTEYEKKYHLTDDPGRFNVTKDETDRNTWRTPTWRNVAITAPYFHNGQVKTLDEAVRVMVKVQLNKDATDDEVKDIVAFLESLTGEIPTQTMPHLPQTPTHTVLVDDAPPVASAK